MRNLIVSIFVFLTTTDCYAVKCENLLPRLSQEISSQNYNYSGVDVTLNPGESKTYCGYWFPEGEGSTLIPSFTTSSEVVHSTNISILGFSPVNLYGKLNTKDWVWQGGEFSITIGELESRGTVSIRTNFPPSKAKTCVGKIESSSGTVTVRMPLGAPNPNIEPRTKPNPSAKPTPVFDKDCDMGTLPELNLSGFPNWLGLRNVSTQPGKTQTWCVNLNRTTSKWTMSVIDRTGAWQCMYHTVDYIPPVGSGLKTISWKKETTNTTATWRNWDGEALPQGTYKIRITASSSFPDCPMTYEVNAHK